MDQAFQCKDPEKWPAKTIDHLRIARFVTARRQLIDQIRKHANKYPPADPDGLDTYLNSMNLKTDPEEDDFEPISVFLAKAAQKIGDNKKIDANAFLPLHKLDLWNKHIRPQFWTQGKFKMYSKSLLSRCIMCSMRIDVP